MNTRLFVLVFLLCACHRVACQIVTTLTELPPGPITFPLTLPTGAPSIIFIPTGTITVVIPGCHPTPLPPGESPSTTGDDSGLLGPAPRPPKAACIPARGKKVNVGGDTGSNDGSEGDFEEGNFEADASDEYDNGDDGDGVLERDPDGAFDEE
ncbi:hypothetical protein PpBr36_02182 [Pyricularia pennisetigena]|uniref:hypothetical protein n=1 Tax=Pyricularia pennisetigena TaxID=1578925 RepID=UPI0011512836|nr:hypothetical protein PpBr36_02182 [Pyricularia pennisetigena]TLS30278.1 hypothetical protein PpBr36_02182 [Pyricularia pennisetigena]